MAVDNAVQLRDIKAANMERESDSSNTTFNLQPLSIAAMSTRILDSIFSLETDGVLWTIVFRTMKTCEIARRQLARFCHDKNPFDYIRTRRDLNRRRGHPTPSSTERGEGEQLTTERR